ncbi:hypothetical protein [Methylobacterium sp. J-070]|uniref:hypothetical protein n=1 Tax=Methylobacterium sp. J-070 TaxID=2836650 RepID=UPI001FB90B08|nr:hypothetical protein [Methylobacterium sp. J-070]MCJ2052932.1 hypothetical protein [Methylobacterium sp. J-070]
MGDRFRLPPDFETFPAAKLERETLAGQLGRSHVPGASELSKRLGACFRDRRCGSGACRVCQRKERKILIRAANVGLPKDRPLLRISWVPRGGVIPLGGLAGFDLRRFIASRLRALQRALPGITAFGGVDVSLNTFENGTPVWVVHLYLLIEAADSKLLRAAIRARCRGEPSAPRPFHFQKVSRAGRAKVFSYALKPAFYKRSGFIDATGRANTRPQALPAGAAVEAALFLDRWPLQRRLILHGMRLVRGRDGLRLVRRDGGHSRRGSRA